MIGRRDAKPINLFASIANKRQVPLGSAAYDIDYPVREMPVFSVRILLPKCATLGVVDVPLSTFHPTSLLREVWVIGDYALSPAEPARGNTQRLLSSVAMSRVL